MGGALPKEVLVTVTNVHEIELVGISCQVGQMAMGDVPFKLRGNELHICLVYRPRFIALTIYYFHKVKSDYLQKTLYLNADTLDIYQRHPCIVLN